MFGQVTIVTLPSGDKVRAKRPSLVTMLAAGVFPNDLTAHALRLYNKEIPEQPEKVENPEQALSTMRLMDTFIRRVLFDPKVGDVTEVTVGEDGVQTGTTMLEDIPDPDKQWLFLWGQSLLPDDASKPLSVVAASDNNEQLPPAEEVAPFRGGDERPDAGPARAEVPPTAVQPVGDPAGTPVGA